MKITIGKVKLFFQTYKPEECNGKGLTHAGVLVTLFEKNDELHVILTLRTEEVEHHKGQVSFPGGTKDKEDRTIIDTALREADEEIGIKRGSVEILGTLSDFCTPSGFCITPVVGFIKALPPFKLNKAEVTEVFDIPLSFFMDLNNVRTEEHEYSGAKRTVYFYNWDKYQIWGATAAMLRSFLGNFTK